jgi:uracil-DNA glycosylase
MLAEAGINRSEVFLTNVCRERPKANDIGDFIALKKKDITIQHVSMRDKMVKRVVVEGYKLLLKEIEMVQPNLIIACGNTSMWALTGKWGVTDWRGSELHALDVTYPDGWSPTVLPTYHPVAILRQWSWRPIMVHDLRKAKRMAEKRSRVGHKITAIVGHNIEEASKLFVGLIAKLREGPTWLSVDIETRAGHIACIGFAANAHEGFCIPLMTVANTEGYWSVEDETSILSLIKDVLMHPNCKIIGQNFSYDAQYIDRWWGFLPIVSHDTMLAQHSMFSNLPKDLGFLSSMYCDSHIFWKHDGKTWDKGIGEMQLWTYNVEDCCRTFEVAMAQQKVLQQMGMEAVNEFQQSLFGPVHRAMQRGVRIDQKMRGQLAMDLQEAIAEREKWLMDVCGHPLNPRSPAQMYRFFVDDLQQKPSLKRRSTGAYTPSFDDEALRKMASREPLLRPIVEVIADIRSLGIFFSTFVGADLDWDGRIRCAYNIGGTKTYRFSSNSTPFDVGTNLQNLSSGDKE